MNKHRRSSDSYNNGGGLVIAIVVCLLIMALFDCNKTEASELNLENIYIKVGAGYKFEESVQHVIYQGERNKVHPISARIELYWQYTDNLTFGISHHSQWATGFPFNDTREPSKTELFIDYKFSLVEIF